VLRGDGNTYKLYPTVWDSGPCGCSNLSAVKLVAGDFTGDGKTDLAQLYDLGNATWEIRVWAAKGLVAGQPAFEAPTVWLKAVPGTSDWNHVKIVTGDVDGDGKADIAEFYDYQGGQTKLWMHYSQRVAPSGAFAFTDAILKWDSGVGNWWWTASTFVAGDFTGDGKADVGIFYDYGNGVWRLWTLTGSSGGVDGPFEVGSPIGSSDTAQLKPFAGDFTGDGRADVGHLYNYGNAQTKLWTLSSTGAAFGVETLRWDSGPGVLDWNRATPQ